MIIGSRIFDELETERTLCITGHLSGGKTRLAFDLALRYWRSGYRVISNIPHNFIDRGSDFDGRYDLYHSFVILDEAGEFIRQAKVASSITRSAGKADYFAVFAGKRLPHKNLQDIVVRPRFNFWINYGIPLILWRARINADEKYNVVFWQAFPQLVHGTYSTKTSAGSIQQIFRRAEITVRRLAENEGQEAGKQQEAGILGFADDLAEALSGELS